MDIEIIINNIFHYHLFNLMIKNYNDNTEINSFFLNKKDKGKVFFEEYFQILISYEFTIKLFFMKLKIR